MKKPLIGHCLDIKDVDTACIGGMYNAFEIIFIFTLLLLDQRQLRPPRPLARGPPCTILH